MAKAAASWCALLCFLILCVAPSGVTAFNVTIDQQGDLATALYNTTISIPDFSFQVAIYDVSVSNLECYHTTVAGVAGQLYGLIQPKPSDPLSLNLELRVYGITMNCTADWSYKSIIKQSGTMILTVGNETAVGFRITVQKNVTQPPSPSSTPTPSISISSSQSASSSASVSVSASSSCSISGLFCFVLYFFTF